MQRNLETLARQSCASSRLRVALASVVLACALTPGALAQELDESWTVTLNGQAVQVNPDGTFTIPNVSSPDLFGPDGPGSAPDFLSDDYVRLTGVRGQGTDLTYVYSEPFKLSQGQTFFVGGLTVSDSPPPIPVSISLTLGSAVIEVGASSAATVMALLANGSSSNVSLGSAYTTYRTSNPSVVSVNVDGQLTGVGAGTAFVTASNEGAVSVAQISVVNSVDELTTVLGGVVFEDGTGAEGAQVRVLGQAASTVTGADGNFQLADVVASGAPIVLIATLETSEGFLAGSSGSLEGVAGGLTDGGLIELAPSTSSGRDFVLCFPANHQSSSPNLTLFIAGDEVAEGLVTIGGVGFTAPFAVVPGQITTVPLPPASFVSVTDGVQNRAVRVTATSNICVYGLNQVPFTTDAFAALPINSFQTRYRAISFDAAGSTAASSELAVVAAQPGTTVTITPATSLSGHAAGAPYQVLLNTDEVYQLRSVSGDVTGTLISADAPIGLFSGHGCANVPTGFSFCDHLVEQVPPVGTWGMEVLVVSLASRLNGDVVRVLADEDGTSIEVRGDSPNATVLDAGHYAQFTLEGTNQIVADKPVLVAQYSTGSSYGGNPGDPFMMLLPPAEQYQAGYTFSTPGSGFASHYVNVVAPQSVIAGGVALDGVAIAAGEFTAISDSGFFGARLSIAGGSHRLESAEPVGVFVYGFNQDDSYGYPGGMALFSSE